LHSASSSHPGVPMDSTGKPTGHDLGPGYQPHHNDLRPRWTRNSPRVPTATIATHPVTGNDDPRLVCSLSLTEAGTVVATRGTIAVADGGAAVRSATYGPAVGEGRGDEGVGAAATVEPAAESAVGLTSGLRGVAI
jgi:hypothetical protein